LTDACGDLKLGFNVLRLHGDQPLHS